MSKPDDNGGGAEHGVTRERVAVLSLSLNMATGKLTVGGSAPTYEFAKPMCQMGADEFERLIAARRVDRGIALAGPELLRDLRG
jgi:hypothetical protein